MNTIQQTDIFEDWLDGLADTRAQKAVAREIVKMEGGLFADAKHIDGPVWEARIHYGPGYRLYYTQIGKVIYLLLCGGTKGTQKDDIKTAKELAAQL